MRKLFLIALAFVVTTSVAAPTKPTLASPPAAFDLPAIDTYINARLKELELAGLSVAIVKDGKVVLAKGYGARSLEPRLPVTTNTLFAIGSVTKQFVCAAILLLAEDGKLSADDKVAKYFPNLTKADEISLLDLMTHVSGYPDYYPLDFVDRRMASPIAADELIRHYAGGNLDFEPRTRWSYSNTGYVILGRVIEMASGSSFHDFIQRRILDPVGMTNSTFQPKKSGQEIAEGYSTFALGPLAKAEPEADHWIFAAGDLYSTATDLAKWDLALIDGKILKPESYKLMTSHRQLANQKRTTYGCGLSISFRESWLMLSHAGAVSGFAARNAAVPATRSAVIMLSNTDSGGGLTRLHNTILSLLLQTPSNVPNIAGLSATEAAKKFFGQLQSGKVDRKQLGEEFSVFLDEAKLRGASDRLKRYGEPQSVALEESRERGGMEVTNLRFTFKSETLGALMYRTPDGKIQEFFLEK